MRSAFAKGLGIGKDKVVDVDVKTGMVAVDLGDAEVDTVALAAALKATSKYSLVE